MLSLPSVQYSPLVNIEDTCSKNPPEVKESVTTTGIQCSAYDEDRELSRHLLFTPSIALHTVNCLAKFGLAALTDTYSNSKMSYDWPPLRALQ